MEGKKELVRGQFYMTRELKEWYDSESLKTGMTKNALYLTALIQYRETREKNLPSADGLGRRKK